MKADARSGIFTRLLKQGSPGSLDRPEDPNFKLVIKPRGIMFGGAPITLSGHMVPTFSVQPTLNKPRQITYWLRCLKTYLPSPYESSDSNRLSLAFFMLTSLDLLSALDSHVTPEEKDGYINWIYRCQHPHGGFRGSTSTDLGEKTTLKNEKWDSASIPSTYFALAALLTLGDDLSRVKREQCLHWLPRLQRDNGCFGEALLEDEIEGGTDTRLCLFAAGIRWILRGRNGKSLEKGMPDIRLEALRQYIYSCESYEHGFSDGQYHEAHAGLTYCAIGALSFLERGSESLSATIPRLPSKSATIRWLVSRQLEYLSADTDDESDEDTTETNLPSSNDTTSKPLDVGLSVPKSEFAGFNGRMNKDPDTCYSYWVGASLSMLQVLPLTDVQANRRFLLSITQSSLTGGFSKEEGAPVDILHASLGLAALALAKQDGLKELDPVMCITLEARERLRRCEWWKE